MIWIGLRTRAAGSQWQKTQSRTQAAAESSQECATEVRYDAQVYNMKQAQADIESVYSMGLFDDVNILPSPAEDSTADAPKVQRKLCLVH